MSTDQQKLHEVYYGLEQSWGPHGTLNVLKMRLCRLPFKSKPKKIKPKTASSSGNSIAKRKGGVEVSCNNLGPGDTPKCTFKVKWSALKDLPTVHVADLEMEKLFGVKGSKRKKLNQQVVQKRLKKIKQRKAKRAKTKAAKKRRARKAKRKKAKEARLKKIRKFAGKMKCKKGKKGKKCRKLRSKMKKK